VCKDHKRAEKKLDIWKLPKYLVIHLKRFSFTSTFRSKIDTLVEFPLEGLDLAQYEKGNIDPSQRSSTYHLVAISVWTTRSLVSVNDSTNTHTLSLARVVCVLDRTIWVEWVADITRPMQRTRPLVIGICLMTDR
jgi:hypothetical protein